MDAAPSLWHARPWAAVRWRPASALTASTACTRADAVIATRPARPHCATTKRTRMPLRRCRTHSVPPPLSPLLGEMPLSNYRELWPLHPLTKRHQNNLSARAPNMTGDRVLASALAFGNSRPCCEMHPQSFRQGSPKPCLRSPSVRLMTLTGNQGPYARKRP